MPEIVACFISHFLTLATVYRGQRCIGEMATSLALFLMAAPIQPEPFVATLHGRIVTFIPCYHLYTIHSTPSASPVITSNESNGRIEFCVVAVLFSLVMGISVVSMRMALLFCMLIHVFFCVKI